MSTLHARLDGDSAELGKIPASDVARLILAIERAVAQAASAAVGDPKLSSGRRKASVAQAARLVLRELGKGSLRALFEVPDPTRSDLNLSTDDPGLSEIAIMMLFDAAEQQHQNRVVSRALLELAEVLHIGERYELTLSYESPRYPAARVAHIDQGTRARLQAWLEQPISPMREDSVVGTLTEADFERLSARLRTPTGGTVAVTFTESLADRIQESLRRQGEFEGRVTYDSETSIARSVQLTMVHQGQQLVLGVDANEFWMTRTLEELAEEQHTVRSVDPEALYDPEATDDEREAFLAELANFGY